MAALQRRGGALPDPPAIYAIADAVALEPRSLTVGLAEMIEAGMGWIQIRAKEMEGEELFRTVDACCRLAAGRDTMLWIDDRPDIATLLPVSGLHLGQEDLPPAVARSVVGEDLWIGRSTHSEAQTLEAEGDPEVDVIALGPIFETGSKENPDPVVGVELLRRVRSRVSKPLVAIGGIDESTLEEVLEAGADSVAMIGALCGKDLRERCRRLQQLAAETLRQLRRGEGPS